MKLDIILQILFTNDMQDVVARAVQLENNIPLPFKAGDTLITQVTKNELPEGKAFKGNEHYGYVSVPVIAINEYSLAKPYLVQMPGGKTEWVKGNADRSTISELVDKDTMSTTLSR